MKTRPIHRCPSCNAVIVRAVPLCRECLDRLPARIAGKMTRFYEPGQWEEAEKWRGEALRVLRGREGTRI